MPNGELPQRYFTFKLRYIVAELYTTVMDITDLSENDETVLKWLCLRLRLVGNKPANRKNSQEDIPLPRKDINESYSNLEKMEYIDIEGNLIIAKQKMRGYC